MKFSKFQPSDHLKHLITYFWELKSSETDVPTATYRFVPDGYVDWIFHLGAPWQCDFPDAMSSTNTGKFHVFGQIKKHVDLKLPENNLHLFGVKFNPWVVKKIWNVDMHYLTNSCVAIEELGLINIQQLQDQILNASDLYSRIPIMEGYLTSYAHLKADNSLKQVLTSFSNESTSLNNKSTNFGVRRLEQRFKSEIGISPKLFYRTQRINKVINQITTTKNQSLTQVAFENNYFDQSHFIRDFRLFTGLSPTRFLKSINPNGDILNLRVS